MSIVIKQQSADRNDSSGRRMVFLVHGRDLASKTAMVSLLRAFDLRVISWDEAAASTGQATPFTGDVVLAGMRLADAVVVLLTPDDLGHVRGELALPGDSDEELTPTPQARMNVLFEAGMAMAFNRDSTVLIEVGKVRPMSDTAGLNVIRFSSGTISERSQLANRLRAAGLAIDMNSPDWATAGDFSLAGVTS